MPIQIALDSLKQAASGTANSATFLRGDNTFVAANVAANSAIASPVLSGTATGTYTLAGTPTITNPTLTLQSENVSPFIGFRNRIINGAMVIDQRNAGASVTPTAAVYGLDRWKMSAPAASKYSFQQNAGSVTPPAGFKNYLGVTSLSAYSVTTSQAFVAYQLIEGYNVSDLGWGAAGASSVTLSFWVRSSLTGTFGGALGNVNATRSYPFTYTISSANTWEQKTITIAGDTTGTWNSTNDVGLAVYLGFGVGATVSGTAGAWAGAEYYSATGATSVVGTNGATFYVTGVQLEKGTVATPFEFRSHGQELLLCRRYFTSIGSGAVMAICTGSTSWNFSVIFPVEMRAAPSFVGTSGSLSGVITDSAFLDYTISTTGSIANGNLMGARMTGFITSASGAAGRIAMWNSSSSVLLFNAEL